MDFNKFHIKWKAQNFKSIVAVSFVDECIWTIMKHDNHDLISLLESFASRNKNMRNEWLLCQILLDHSKSCQIYQICVNCCTHIQSCFQKWHASLLCKMLQIIQILMNSLIFFDLRINRCRYVSIALQIVCCVFCVQWRLNPWKVGINWWKELTFLRYNHKRNEMLELT